MTQTLTSTPTAPAAVTSAVTSAATGAVTPLTPVLAVRASITIGRCADEVWGVVSDYALDTAWRKGITEMTPDPPGPPAVGTHVREVLTLGGREYITEADVTNVGPGRRYQFAGAGTTGVVRGSRTVVASEMAGTSVFSYHVFLEPQDVSPLVRPLMRWYLERSLRRDLKRLKAMIENRR